MYDMLYMRPLEDMPLFIHNKRAYLVDIAKFRMELAR